MNARSKIPVRPERGGEARVLLLPVSDVMSIEQGQSGRHTVHTDKSQYRLEIPWSSLEDWLLDEGFVLADSDKIINIDRVSEYDSCSGVIRFGAKNGPETKTATVAAIHRERVKKLLDYVRRPDAPLSFGKNRRGAAAAFKWKDKVESRLRTKEQPVHYLETYDPVTRIPNRDAFRINLAAELQTATASNVMTAVILLNIDRMASINETFGYAAGDQALREAAQVISGYLSGRGSISSFGADQFCIFVSGVTHLGEVNQLASGLMEHLARHPFRGPGLEFRLTASCGISLYPNDGTDADALIRKAHIAADAAKNKGGGASLVYHPVLDRATYERFKLECELRRAFLRKELYLEYQPCCEFKSERIRGAEAILRWKHPEQGLIPAEQILTAAEDAGLIVPLGEWLLKEACLQNRRWRDMSLPPVYVSVNVASMQLEHPCFYTGISAALVESGMEAESLCLKIQETASRKLSRAAASISRLSTLGVHIVLDSSINAVGVERDRVLRLRPGSAAVEVQSELCRPLSPDHFADLVRRIGGEANQT